MKKLLLRFAACSLFVLPLVMASCSEDDAAPDSPSVSAPSTITNVQISTSADISFDVNVPGGYALATVTASGGSATIKSQPTIGDKTGAVVVTYSASSSIGAGAIMLAVTDNNAKATVSTAVINLTAVPVIPPVEVNAAITSNTTWTADKKYVLKGNIYVHAPAELTIEPGTVILGDKTTKGALIISRGAKIHAVGTAAKPIVFTSGAPKTFRNYGDWGGVVILGKATNNQSTDQLIEGITAGDDGRHGGSTDDDNSGELQYVRIEFAGIALSTDNELNGLTFGSVGSATKVDHVQVSYSGDDSFEWFGGKVNGSHLIAYRGWDDDFDTDFGYSGFNQFLVSFRHPDAADKSGSNCFESDNDGQGTIKTPQTAPTFANVTLFGPFMYANLNNAKTAIVPGNISGNYKRGAHLRRNTGIKIYNSVFAGANVDGVFFEQPGGETVFKGNYIGRISGSAMPTPVANLVVGGTVYDASGFATDNSVSDPVNKLDQTAIFAGSTDNLWQIATPKALLAAGSPLLTGAVALPTFPAAAGFDTSVTYRGAFDATNDWANSTWTNYDPNSVDY